MFEIFVKLKIKTLPGLHFRVVHITFNLYFYCRIPDLNSLKIYVTSKTDVTKKKKKRIIADRAPHSFPSSAERERRARARWLASGVNLH